MTRAVRHVVDGATLLEFPGVPDAAANEDARALAAALAKRRPPGLLDAIPGARTLLVLFDPERLDHAAAEDLLLRTLPTETAGADRILRLRTVYGGTAGPDLDSLAERAHLPTAELVRAHAEAEHRVAFLGFAPGFPYLTGAPPELAVPRLASPRVRVPAGSVAVADGYTGIYPAELPGGWHLIGRVDARLFDPNASPPSLLLPGDRVVFEPVAAASFSESPSDEPAPAPRAPLARVISPGSFTTLQGGPRHGFGFLGVAAGGAMDLPALAGANALLGNAPGAAGLEITIAGPELEVLVPLVFALGGSVECAIAGRPAAGLGPHAVRPGYRLRLGRVLRGARAYVSFEGGLAQVPPGEAARPLRAGDVLGRAEQAPPDARGLRADGPKAATPLEVRVVPGPHLGWFSAAGVETFFSSEYTLSARSNRRGLRLEGPRIELSGPADVPPEGVAPGSVQVPGEGQPIALGPDGPVTGGYPRIATVIGADLPLLAQARPGHRIRFRAATLAEALAARRKAR